MQSAADGFKSGRWEGKEYKAIIPKQAQRMPISYIEPRRISISSRSSATSEASEESQRTTNRIIPIIAMARNYSSNHLKEERKEQRARERERERESALEGGRGKFSGIPEQIPIVKSEASYEIPEHDQAVGYVLSTTPTIDSMWFILVYSNWVSFRSLLTCLCVCSHAVNLIHLYLPVSRLSI